MKIETLKYLIEQATTDFDDLDAVYALGETKRDEDYIGRLITESCNSLIVPDFKSPEAFSLFQTRMEEIIQREEKAQAKKEQERKATFKVPVQLEIKLTAGNIDDILDTAFGYISYWYYSVRPVGEYLANWASEQISRGGTLIFHVVDSRGKWELTREKFIKGFRMALENGYVPQQGIKQNRFNPMSVSIDTGLIDGQAADVIVQYALFDNIIFG